MIGNDVVDFEQAYIDGRYDRSRFLNKVFNPNEKKQILLNKDPHRIACIYWSVKEAAYKAYVRETRDRFLNPKRIYLQLKDGLTPSKRFLVSIDCFSYTVEIEVNEHSVVSVANSINQINTELFRNTIKLPGNQYAIQNEYTRDTVLCFFSRHLNKPKHCFSITKDGLGIPFLSINGSKNQYQISLTHHGMFAACIVTV